LNCRGKKGSIFPADAGFISSKDPTTAAVCRHMMLCTCPYSFFINKNRYILNMDL
jgi:hypothetical protein